MYSVGPDGTVRLRRYLPLAGRHWFNAECEGEEGCGHGMPIGIAYPALVLLLRLPPEDRAGVEEILSKLRRSAEAPAAPTTGSGPSELS